MDNFNSFLAYIFSHFLGWVIKVPMIRLGSYRRRGYLNFQKHKGLIPGDTNLKRDFIIMFSKIKIVVFKLRLARPDWPRSWQPDDQLSSDWSIRPNHGLDSLKKWVEFLYSRMSRTRWENKPNFSKTYQAFYSCSYFTCSFSRFRKKKNLWKRKGPW